MESDRVAKSATKRCFGHQDVKVEDPAQRRRRAPTPLTISELPRSLIETLGEACASAGRVMASTLKAETPAAQRPGSVDQAERLVRMIPLQTIPMANGVLGVAEVSKHIGFPVHRAYYIKDVPAGATRGGHGH